MYRVILFDLDGTLTKSGLGITNSVQYALTKMGCPTVPREELDCFVGPPLKEQFMWFADFREDEAEQAVKYYREYYEPKGAYENELYPGIPQLLKRLYNMGYTLAVASSKPTYFVEKILKYFHIESYFEVAIGSELDGRRVEKAEVIEEALRQLGCQNDRSQVIMVGDREYDVLGARAAGMDCLAVSYGYGSEQELEGASPLAIAGDAEEIEEFFNRDYMKRQNVFLRLWRCLYPIGLHWVVSGVLASVLAGFILALGYSTEEYYKMAVWITGITSVVIIPLALLFFFRDRKMRRERGYGEKFTVVQGIWAAFFACGVGYFTNIVIGISGIVDLSPTFNELNEEILGKQNFFTMIVCVSILAPMAEELIFRGLVYKRLKDYSNVPVAILISSVLFGAYHGNLVQFIYATAVGAAFALLYEASDNIWIPMIAHMASNLWSSVLNEFSDFFSAGPGGIIFIGIMAVMFATLIYGIIYFVKNRKNLGLPHF